MTQPQPIPKLDLAPKLNRPLSLWNPLDYLRLLYWCFYFPQALRWYNENYGGGESLAAQTIWQKKIEFLRQNPNQLKLWIQGLLLTVIVPFALCGLLEQIGFDVEWLVVGLGVGFSVAFGAGFGIAGSVAYGVAFGIAGSVAFGIAGSVGLGVARVMAFGVAGGTAYGVVYGVAGGIAGGIARSVGLGVVFGVVFMMFGVAYGLAYGLAFGLAIVRPDKWLIYSLFLPLLTTRLKKWLRQDWLLGLQNSNELLKYSLQFIPVVKGVNQVLTEIPSEQIIFRVSQLAEDPYDWKLVKFASVSLSEELKSQMVEGFFLLPKSLKQQLQQFFSTDFRFDTPTRATAAGFWYLHEKDLEQATKAFAVVRDLLYGEEMWILAQTLTQFQAAENSNSIAAIELPPFPSESLLRPTTWNTLNGFRRVVEDVQLVLGGTSKAARSFALNRAIGELTTIVHNADTLPKAEQGLIVEIANTWTPLLVLDLGVNLGIGNISITESIQNPYVIGDPVEGSLFVGREDILRQLEELWVMGQNLQSVVLYGHRRMGKTSILRNIANRSGADVQVIYINLQRLGTVSEGMAEVLMAISDGISDALGVPPPEDEALLRLPQRTFERYLTKVVREMNQKGLIIALDEFEMIEELIEAEQIPPNFMGVLRGLVQMSSKVAFVFAGLHTLEEMTEDYFQPFFASVIPIPVGFLKPASTRQVLANPNDDFLLNYTGDALDLIHNLTAGQPYLVQLVGFLLVRRYNDYVFELGRSRDSTFTIEDVEAVINDPEFFSRGRYYFTGVWNQAKQGSVGQQEILKELAAYREGLTVDILGQRTGLDQTQLNEALKTLERHDVVRETEKGWKIIVELFRRWVCENHKSDIKSG